MFCTRKHSAWSNHPVACPGLPCRGNWAVAHVCCFRPCSLPWVLCSLPWVMRADALVVLVRLDDRTQRLPIKQTCMFNYCSHSNHVVGCHIERQSSWTPSRLCRLLVPDCILNRFSRIIICSSARAAAIVYGGMVTGYWTTCMADSALITECPPGL